MLKESKAFSSFSVGNIDKAREFYQSTLGLNVKDVEMGNLEIQIDGSAPITIYPKADHKPATFTVLNFPVRNINAMADQLIAKGITFEQYDYENLKTDPKGIFKGDGRVIAWFKDPFGNILSIIEIMPKD